MIVLQSCSGCGGSAFDVTIKDNYKFLTCKNCGNDVAILNENNERNEQIAVSSSGLMYSGMIITSSGMKI